MTREMWDREAAAFDSEPDHGLTDPLVRAAWRELLLDVLPPAPATVADLGCGTGTLTALLTDDGYVVHGVDFSHEMVSRAHAKVPDARFVIGDVSTPPLERGVYDVVLSRHVLWALPDPRAAFSVWVDLLTPDGIAVLVEGSWSTGAGVSAADAEEIVRERHTSVNVRHLTEPVYWGKKIDDERYLLVSRA